MTLHEKMSRQCLFNIGLSLVNYELDINVYNFKIKLFSIYLWFFFYRSYLRNSTTSLLGGSLEITLIVPLLFRSVSHAIEWCVRSGQARNLDSARVSMPGSQCNKALCS